MKGTSVGQRFGIEGCEVLLAGLRALVRQCAAHGVERMEVGLVLVSSLPVLTCRAAQPFRDCNC